MDQKGKSASNVVIYSGCFNGQKRNYCCPTDHVPNCHWARLPYAVAIPAQRKKFKSQPINLPRAIAVGSTINRYAVLRRHPMQQLDSTSTNRVEIEWSGSAPDCVKGDNHAGCASDYPEYLTDSIDEQDREDEKFVLYRPRSLSELLMDDSCPYNSRSVHLQYSLSCRCDTFNQQTSLSCIATQGNEDYDLPQLCERDDCYTVPKLHSKEFRELLWSIGNATEEDSDEIFGGLFPRARKPKICQNKKTISTFKAKNYPSVGTLSATRQFYGVVKSGAKTAICNGLPITLGKRILGTNYMVEHVTELQTPAQFATCMLSGKLSSGAAAPGAASNYDWTQVFSQNGYFFQTWAQLGVTQPTGLTGDTPVEAIANALGSTADISNLQILDAPTNGLKAAAWQLFDNIISPKRFSAESAQGKVDMINRLYDTLPGYLNSADVQDSLEYGYKVIKAAMGALDQAAQNNPNVNGITASSFEDAWITYSKDFFEQMQGNLQDFVTARINEVTKYWSSSAATKAFTKAGAAAVAKALGEKLSGVSTDVVIDSSFVQ
ncbi:uncharacterized protein BO87DRAFT_453714 [Aspergillus neoniger CBS 115656]|uniref:Uncharacterized protein n=1 Tax=Aspergillus neoniger (strain CBS 115656) TaxID=1448310 RepID=A0A318Y755_ASPNB|nr:hypothetical protein BO87DRAFT_453714 [Aspergillus neoniger CBS 115656]PYH28143.1 hypothetical protein BO87DRAFT_453714 [Aspergillus neoniger CBS 115656]